MVTLSQTAAGRAAIRRQHASGRRMRTAIRDGLGYLSRHLDLAGRFDYDMDIMTGLVSRKYHMLRHAGTTMVLWRLVDSPFDDGSLRASSARALAYLQTFLRASPFDADALCLAHRGTAKLGGSALALLAFAEAARNACPPAEADMIVERLAGISQVSKEMTGGLSRLNPGRPELRAARSSGNLGALREHR
ncbi:MAG: hypothetical protein WCE44_16720 [Candidatus Velthaea sp.]